VTDVTCLFEELRRLSVYLAESRRRRRRRRRLLADVSIEDRFTRLTLYLAAPDELAVAALDVPHLNAQPKRIRQMQWLSLDTLFSVMIVYCMYFLLFTSIRGE